MFFPVALYLTILMCCFRFAHNSRVEESDGENLTVPFGFFPSNGEPRDVVRIGFSLMAFGFFEFLIISFLLVRQNLGNRIKETIRALEPIRVLRDGVSAPSTCS